VTVTGCRWLARLAGIEHDVMAGDEAQPSHVAGTIGASNQLVLTWVDGRDGLNREHVFFTSSTDGGDQRLWCGGLERCAARRLPDHRRLADVVAYRRLGAHASPAAEPPGHIPPKH
jgi:hypothetical protein